MSDVN